jgi:methyl-accepting chemotaxis protein
MAGIRRRDADGATPDASSGLVGLPSRDKGDAVMLLAYMKIGTRLTVGFGLVLMLLAALLVVGLTRLASIADNSQQIDERWVKADAAQIINARTRWNARNTLELFIASDAAHTARIQASIDANRKAIDEAMETLRQRVSSAQGMVVLNKVEDTRARYVMSFTQVGKLLAQGRRDEATEMVRKETLPALDALQDEVRAMVVFQRQQMEVAGAQARLDIASARRLIVGLGTLAVMLGLGLAWWITRSITQPLGEAVQVAQAVASGDLTGAIDFRSMDETGLLMQALNDMKGSLARTVGKVRDAADSVVTSTSQISAGNIDLSQRTEQQAASLEQTAAIMDELTATAKQNAGHAREAGQLAGNTAAIAVCGGDVMSEVVQTMRGITDRSKQIEDVIRVIDEIAFQTNILALNAAVEAARAGEQGRGFAVVAAEVRRLAQCSANAARGSRELIEDSTRQVARGSQLVEQAGRTMDEIVQAVRGMSDRMSEIAAASAEQSSGVEQVNRAVSQMDEVTQQNAALVEEAAAAAGSLEDQTRHLKAAVSVFRLPEALEAKDGTVPYPRRETLSPGQRTPLALPG